MVASWVGVLCPDARSGGGHSAPAEGGECEYMASSAFEYCCLFVSSPSGTGKTLAYLLPILHLLHLPTLSSSLFSPPHIPSSRLRQLHKRPQEGKRSAAANRSAPAGSGAAAATAAVAASGPFCLVLTPTLELANQVAEEVRRFTRFVPELTVDVVTAAASQQAASQANLTVDVVTAAAAQQAASQASALSALPPAPRAGRHAWPPAEALPRGRPCIRHHSPRVRAAALLATPLHPSPPLFTTFYPPCIPQVILVSATILPESELLLRRFAPRGDMLIVQPSSSDKPLGKWVAFLRENHQVLVFVRTVHRVERLHQTLCEGGITAVRLHGELTGPVRSQSLEMFRQGNAQVSGGCVEGGGCSGVLVSTNVAARGVDIPNLPFVVNFDPPGSPQEYLHRIGRTGRAGASGTAISFLEPLNEESSIGKRALATESQLGGRVQEESSQKADMPDWMAAAQELLGQRIEFRKVPGPWRDDPDDIEDSVIPSSARPFLLVTPSTSLRATFTPSPTPKSAFESTQKLPVPCPSRHTPSSPLLHNGRNSYTFRARVRCFVAFSTTFSSTGSPFLLLTPSTSLRATFTPSPTPESPYSSLSSSVRGTKNGSSATINQWLIASCPGGEGGRGGGVERDERGEREGVRANAKERKEREGVRAKVEVQQRSRAAA
ncbi:unnamed protein product [Closterium sp. NIES-65]|nr:unnamed protein product [Closterium sp. NIES-65]